jgi:hypothetical protein
VEAKATYQRALMGREETLGPDHTLMLDTVCNLGNLYICQDRLVDAETMYQRALAGYEKALEPNHMLVLYVFNSLGILYTP